MIYAVKSEAADAIREIIREEWGRPAGWDGPLVGYFCTYTPLELLHAAGARARRVFPPEPPGKELDLHRAAAHLPGFVCPFIKRSLEHALAGGVPHLDGLVHAYSCDVTCGVFNIWKEHLKPEVAVMLHQPYRLNPASLQYYRDELRGCAQALAGLTGQVITAEGLREAAELYNGQRSYLRRLAEELRGAAQRIPAALLFELVIFCQLRPVEQANALLKRVCKVLDGQAGPEPDVPNADVRRAIVSGSVLEDARAFRLVGEAGGQVVADDLCTGSRWYEEDISVEGDPWEELAVRYLGRIPCPTRGTAQMRSERLASLLDASQAGSVLFLTQKFCDPHLADVPLLREFLQSRGVPSLLLELEDEGPADEQWKTRLETFFHLGREEG